MPTLKLRHVLLLAFLVRLILIPFFSDDFNYWANMTFTSFLVNGKNPWIVTYNDPTLHWINPWRCPPLQLPLVIPPVIVNELTGNYILMLYAMKLPLVLVDILSIFFVYKILRMWSGNEKKNIRYLSLFAFNPISIWASAFAGSTDPLPTLFMVISLFYFLKPAKNSMFEKNAPALFLGLAIIAKLFPAILFPIFLLKLKKTRERIVFAAVCLLPIALFSLPFLIWDYGSYINMLLFHNVGGFYPFVSFLNPVLSVFLTFPAAFISVLMFGIAYFRKTDILANIVLAFLALFALMGFGYFDTKYFSWFIPFAVLLASRKETKISKSDFLPFIYVPSLVGVRLIFDGSFNAVEGATGFPYFTYHWLRQKIVVFQVLPFSDLIYLATGITSALLIGYYFIKISIRASSFSFPAINSEKLEIIQNIKKNRKLLLISFLITLVSMVAFAKVVPYESVIMGVDVNNSGLHFYDDFSRSILNPQWGVAGNGRYTINYSEVPSYIRLSGNVTLYRGWGPIWHGFKESNEAQVRIILRLDDVLANVSRAPMLVTNGGWFGVIKENNTDNFVYFDNITNGMPIRVPVDLYWHELQINYTQTGRLVSFDKGLSVPLSKESFDHIYLGLPVYPRSEFQRYSFSVHLVEVTDQDSYSGASGIAYAFLALFIPPTIVICVSIFMSKKKVDAKESS